MENRDRDKMSKSTGSTPSGDVNRSTSSSIGQQKSGSSVNFGQKEGHSSNLESDIGDRGRSSSSSSGVQSDMGRSSGSSGLGSSSGRSGSSSLGDIDRSDLNKKSSNRGGGSSSSENL
jgi:hypothetical protein